MCQWWLCCLEVRKKNRMEILLILDTIFIIQTLVTDSYSYYTVEFMITLMKALEV